jgi:hypothetical protein
LSKQKNDIYSDRKKCPSRGASLRGGEGTVNQKVVVFIREVNTLGDENAVPFESYSDRSHCSDVLELIATDCPSSFPDSCYY